MFVLVEVLHYFELFLVVTETIFIEVFGHSIEPLPLIE